MTGYDADQKVVKSYRRGFRFLVLKRTFSSDGGERLALVYPLWLAESLGHTDGVSVRAEDGWREFTLFPDGGPDSDMERVSIATSGSGSAQYRFSRHLTRKLHYEAGDEAVLDIDLRDPENGILVRPLDPGEDSRFGEAPKRPEVSETIEGA